MPMNRRQFLTTTLAGAAGAAAGAALTGQLLAAPDAPAPTNPLDPFQLVPLGRTGIKVSLIGIGTGMKGGMRQSNQTRLGPEKFEALLHYAFDKGIRFFDCADLYGSHRYLAAAFRDKPRDQYVIGSKIWVRPKGIPEAERPDADVCVDRFRKELNTDYIDLVLLHCMVDPQWCDQQKRQMDILENLKAKGVIRAHGVSCHSLAALKAAAESPWVDSVHARINPFGDSMDITDPEKKISDPQIVAGVLKQIHDAGKGVIGMKLVGEGRYRNDPAKRDQAIRFVLGLKSVDMMIVGFEKGEEIDDFAARTQTALVNRKA